MTYEVKNTDQQIWRKSPFNHYLPSIHITESGGIGISVGGHVLVAPIEDWHKAGRECFCVKQKPKKRLTWWRFLLYGPVAPIVFEARNAKPGRKS